MVVVREKERMSQKIYIYIGGEWKKTGDDERKTHFPDIIETHP